MAEKNPAPPAPPAMPPVVRVRLENTTRSVIYLVSKRAVVRGSETLEVIDRDRTIVLGDVADRTLPAGVARSRATPSPDVVMPIAVWQGLTPGTRDFVESEVAAGRIRRTFYYD